MKPVRGRAVLWSNITADGEAEKNTIHAGEAVSISATAVSSNISEGKKSNDCHQGNINNTGDQSITTTKDDAGTSTKKYGLNIWICEVRGMISLSTRKKTAHAKTNFECCKTQSSNRFVQIM